MKRWQIERWRMWEQRACRLVGMEQVGGPGRVDCQDRTRRRVAEVKVGVITKGVIRRTLRKRQYRNADEVLMCTKTRFSERAKAISTPTKWRACRRVK